MKKMQQSALCCAGCADAGCHGGMLRRVTAGNVTGGTTGRHHRRRQ